LFAGDLLVAEATGLFISIPAQKFADLREAERLRKAAVASTGQDRE
jgi:hypothetical protein